MASTARVADSEIAPMRAETRRSVGGVAALMRPIVPDGKRARHTGFEERTGSSVADRSVGSYLFDAGPATTYTHSSLALTNHIVHPSDAVGWGNHKGS